MLVDTQISVRHPFAHEVPAALTSGLESWTIDRDWQWVLVVDGQVVAQLLTANTHGALFLIRLTALPECPKQGIRRLLRETLREAKERGLMGYYTFLGSTREEQKLMRIVGRDKAFFVVTCGAWVGRGLERR